MALTGAQVREFSEALRDAFRNRSSLRRMLRFQLDRNLEDIVGTGGLSEIVADLIDEAESHGWTDNLMRGALCENPCNALLRAFFEKGWLALQTPRRGNLQDIIRGGNRFLDVDPWVTRLIETGPRICQIEIRSNQGKIYGTGFLVGPDVVMTNYHVMEAVLMGAQGKTTTGGKRAAATDIRFRFDYRMLPDGETLNSGSIHLLKGSRLDDWLIDESPPSAADLDGTGQTFPGDEELDYVLVRLAAAAGTERVRQGDPGASRRGWIELPACAPAPVPDAPMIILQHPEAWPLKLVIDTLPEMKFNGNRTRVTYKTNTLGGSSGSPCFDTDWNMIALHTWETRTSRASGIRGSRSRRSVRA